MALPSRKPRENTIDTPEESPRIAPLLGPVERLEAIFRDLLEHAPPEGEDDGWEELKDALDAERPEGMKLFPKS